MPAIFLSSSSAHDKESQLSRDPLSRSSTADTVSTVGTVSTVDTGVTRPDEDGDKSSSSPLKGDSLYIEGYLNSPWRPDPVSVYATRGPGNTILLSENHSGLQVTEESFWRPDGEKLIELYLDQDGSRVFLR